LNVAPGKDNLSGITQDNGGYFKKKDKIENI
jgi:hypothetical protein